MRKHMRRMIPLGLVSLTAGLVAIMLTGTAGLAATQAPPDQHAAADDRRHTRGRQDPDGPRGHVDGQPDRLRLRLASLRSGRRQLLAHQRRGRAHVRAQDRRPGQHAPGRRHRAERRRAPQRDLRPDRGHPGGQPTPPPAARLRTRATRTPVVASELKLPERLSIAGQQVSPAVIGGSTDTIVARFRITACNGKPVQGALVYVTAVPYNMFSVPPEATTGSDGWAELRMNRLRGYPATPRQQLLVMFVRGRGPGGNLLGGISSPPAGLVPGRPQPLGEVDRQSRAAPRGAARASRGRPMGSGRPRSFLVRQRDSAEAESRGSIPRLRRWAHP